MKSEHKQIPCKIFDAHCHIYPDAIAHKAVEGIDQFYDHLPFQPYDGTTGTLYRIGREAGISHYLVHSVATAPHQISSINRFIASEVALSNGAFTGLGCGQSDVRHRLSHVERAAGDRLHARNGSERRRVPPHLLGQRRQHLRTVKECYNLRSFLSGANRL